MPKAYREDEGVCEALQWHSPALQEQHCQVFGGVAQAGPGGAIRVRGSIDKADEPVDEPERGEDDEDRNERAQLPPHTLSELLGLYG